MALQGVTMPPPYGGLDVVSPIDQMDPNYALELVNIFPGPSAPTVRAGYEEVAITGESVLGFAISFLAPLHLNDGSSQLILATNSDLYALNASNVLTKITGTTVLESGQYQHTTYNNKIYLCNGANAVQVYTGTGTVSDVTFTGVNLANLINVAAHKERLYFIEKNTSKFWFGGLQVTGTGGSPALTAFDLSYVFTRGGNLIGIGSFSKTANQSVQDLFFACSSEGEIVFYAGNNAGDPDTWALVARYFIGKPLGYRAFFRVNNDVWILTQQGVVPISGLFESDPESALNYVSQNIKPILSTAAKGIPFSHLWTGFFWPIGRRVYISIPTAVNECEFLVYSIDSKSWTQFRLYSNQHCLSSCIYEDFPYYGSTTGILWKGETGVVDAKTSTSQQPISFNLRMAFSFYNSRGNYKAFKDLRPILKTKRGLQFGLGLDIDFRREDLLPTFTIPVTAFTPWGSPWGSNWSIEEEYIFNRYATKGQGHCAAIRCEGSIENAGLQILGFEVRFDLGGQV